MRYAFGNFDGRAISVRGPLSRNIITMITPTSIKEFYREENILDSCCCSASTIGYGDSQGDGFSAALSAYGLFSSLIEKSIVGCRLKG